MYYNSQVKKKCVFEFPSLYIPIHRVTVIFLNLIPGNTADIRSI